MKMECNKKAKSAYVLLKKKYAPDLPDISHVMEHALNLAIEDGSGAIPVNREI